MTFHNAFCESFDTSQSRKLLLGICLFLIFSHCLLALPNIWLPPSLIPSNNTDIWINIGRVITLECNAYGFPLPRLKWLKNGKELAMSDKSQKYNRYTSNGSNLNILFETHEDDGIFQCMVSNEHGLLLSPPVHIHGAHLEMVYHDVSHIHIKEWMPVKLMCNKMISIPSPSLSWIRKQGGNDDVDNYFRRRVTFDDRIQMDDEGNLHFAYITRDDSDHPDLLYKCYVSNRILDVTRGSSSNHLVVEIRDQVLSPPQLMFSTPSPAIVLEGGSIYLRCFFSGYPLPKIFWYRIDSSGNKKLLRSAASHTPLKISKAQLSDEGVYECKAENDLESMTNTIKVAVHVAPKFLSQDDRPHDMNVTEGGNVTIRCSPHAIPPSNISWLKDGQPLKELPHNYHLSNDSRTLTITNVCKRCLFGTSDLTVVQCIATNEHGSLWGTGYINVLEKTKITTLPQSVELTALISRPSFNCSGTSDPSTPVRILWYKILERPRLLTTYGDLFISSDNKTLSIQPNNISLLNNYVGNYSCHVTNGYSVDKTNFAVYLLVYEPATRLVTLKEPNGYGILYLVVILLISLFLLLLLLIFIFYRNMRCATYLVDEKERECGNEPEKELERNGFLVYNRPMKSTHGSHLSLISSGISYGNASLSEYGDHEASRYDEDGSFIGNYGIENN